MSTGFRRFSYSEIIGATFSRLTVTKIAPSRGRRRYAECQCKCGTTIIVRIDGLLSGHSGSCGCLQRETVVSANLTHGRSRSREYRIWCAMRQRCENSNNSHFHYYGGRGIKVCKRWDSFAAFIEDVGPMPSHLHEIDRYPNKNGNYEPGNVRWVTRNDQMRNTRSNRLLTMNGATQCVAQWSDQLGISDAAIRSRIRRGWDDSRALVTPVQKRRLV